ncbi:MAG: hypothetical protein J4N79_04455, partial [Chloroflexi bacterium]|nr:hypothetical protein [Chloroflexota bacterium]
WPSSDAAGSVGSGSEAVGVTVAIGASNGVGVGATAWVGEAPAGTAALEGPSPMTAGGTSVPEVPHATIRVAAPVIRKILNRRLK